MWFFSPERLWLLSCGQNDRGRRRTALLLKQLNTFLYRNSLAPGTRVGPDIHLGHHSFGIFVHADVTLGAKVRIWHNVTLTCNYSHGTPARLIIEDRVQIGTGAVIIAPAGRTVRIGEGAKIGAGTVVTHDVPAGALVLCQQPRVLTADEQGDPADLATSAE